MAKPEETFDLILIGAGTAGSVLAERLTRSGRHRVLLIEAGGEPSNRMVSVPAGFARLFRTSLDWQFESEPQTHAADRRVFIPRGKMLGGSSNINAQIHQWCHPADFSEWVEAGAEGWSWDEVAPTFQAQEGWTGGEEGGPGRGRTGPMSIAPNRHAHWLSHQFVAAARQAGLGDQPHYNGGHYQGAWIVELAHKDGRRFSAYDAFLKPSLNRSNLTVLRHGQVVRLLIEEGRATGVVVANEGQGERVIRAGGVVLSAGAFGSPTILMRSGIGPADHLQAHGLPVVLDAPEVGANLQDHPMSAVIYRTRGNDTFRRADSLRTLLQYLLFRNGHLASNAAEAMAFAPLSLTGQAGAPPDLEILFAPFEWRNQGLEPPQIDAISFGIAVIAPQSRGSVRLRSQDPFDAPIIDLGLLSDPAGADLRALLAAGRLARRIAATSPLAESLAEEIFPGPDLVTDEELAPPFKGELQTVYHPTSTCRMGVDPRAVVDPSLRLNGIDRAWVVDASVMPRVPRGHPNAVVAMIAERAAGMIESQL